MMIKNKLFFLFPTLNSKVIMPAKSEVSRTPTDDFGDRHTNQLILHSF
jgi:hypothetical protein